LAVEPEILCMDEPFSALDVLTSETLRNEVIDIYCRKLSPVNSILMVTHSVDEGVFMATRLVVMGAHPGTIRAVLDNPLPYPRDEHHPDFLALSRQLHALITQTVLPKERALAPHAVGAPLPMQPIPAVSLGRAIGLLEMLENEGSLDLSALTHHAHMELSQLLLVVKAAELLRWVTTPDDRVDLTAEGHAFLAADINTRKQLLNATLRRMFVFDLIVQGLKKSSINEVDESAVLRELAKTFPHERPLRLLKTAVDWARYAALFKYNSTRRVFHGLAAET
jgi:NitT/TauT family transport system ATP-binding protein